MSRALTSRRDATGGETFARGAADADPVASTARLLRQGGDGRLAVGAWGLRDKYGCTPVPDRDLAALGSCTASSISTGAFRAAERLRRTLAGAAGGGLGRLVEREFERARNEFADLVGVADLTGLEILFGASGTDLHLLAAQFAASQAEGPVQVIMMDAAETGSGVPAALAGRHFAAATALGARVAAGTALARPTRVLNVPLRRPDGVPREQTEVDGDVERAANDAMAEGRHVLLVVVDVSKTGLVAPSPSLAAGLRARRPDAVDVLVDGCQFRLRSGTLRAYLEQGFMVAVTGSKFLGGPIFSGALCVPGPVAGRVCHGRLPVGLADYCASSEWPAQWRPNVLGEGTFNAGLLLRWEAALHELRTFRAVPERRIEAGIDAFRRAVLTRLREDSAFEPLPVRDVDRRHLAGPAGWDELQTIFPFLLYRAHPRGRRGPLDRERTHGVYRLLQEARAPGRGAGLVDARGRYQLGQPVPCGQRDGVPVSALRICVGARLLVSMANHGGEGPGASPVIDAALAALDKASMLARALT